jgi:hypothetical protein
MPAGEITESNLIKISIAPQLFCLQQCLLAPNISLI